MGCGTSVLTATYVLEDTLYSMKLYTLATAFIPVDVASESLLLDTSDLGLSGYNFLARYFGVCNPIRTARRCRKSYSPC